MSCILIVEDNAANAKLIREVLRSAGYDLLEAGDAHQGLELARDALPDLILMDVQLPGMDGLEATRRLKSDPATRDIPVIAVTAHAMRGDEERILAAGCDRYVSKPIRYRELLELVAEYVAR